MRTISGIMIRSGFWDASGHVSTANPQVMTLPMDSQYMQHVGYPVLARYPYLALFEPSLSIPRQVALFCLLNPAVVVELIQHVQELLDTGTHGPRQGLSRTRTRGSTTRSGSPCSRMGRSSFPPWPTRRRAR